MADARTRARDGGLGEKIGPYRVEGRLGVGGMGEVVLAYDERLDRHVAIKRIRHDAYATATDRARFRREARAAAGLSHPAIVQVHDILSDASGDAIVMERVEGESVAERLRRGPLGVAEAAGLAREVAEGLAEAHRAGLVHRDLKAENVMIAPGGHAKVLDFGLAKQLTGERLEETLTQRGAVLGTVRIMSPEQAGGRRVDHRTDLFSLGVLLYEMLSGSTPFGRGSPLETLRRIQNERPRPLAERRPGLPAALVTLVERLLEKEPARRPTDAGEVARELAAIEALARDVAAPAPAPPSGSESFGDAPTGSLGSPPAVPGPPPVREEGETPATAAVRPPARRPLAMPVPVAVAVAVLALAAAGALLWRGVWAPATEPLRVAVPRPEIAAAASPELDLAASAVWVAALSTLAELEGLAPVEPREIGEVEGSISALARAVAADEVLETAIEARDGAARVVLRRVSAGGEELWIGAFDAPLEARRLRLLAEAVTARLQSAYPRRSPRAGAARLEISPEDFTELVEILQRIESGEVDWLAELERLEAISRSSPRFLATHLRGSSIARTLHTDTRDPQYLRRGERLLERARELAPDDPRILFSAFQLALEGGRRDEARSALATLAERAPHATYLAVGRSQLAEHDGDLAAAVAAMEETLERAPSWRYLYRIADLEARRGRVDAARGHLEELLRRAPGHTWGLARLAALELVHGDLERAGELYLALAERKPHRSYYTNLGLARFLLGHYGEARESYLEALAIDPGQPTARLNLADAELAAGEVEAARARYRALLDDLEGRPLGATESLIRAQCLARLGDSQAAAAAALELLQSYPEDSDVVFVAALVHALGGEVASALVHVERALELGYQPRWFAIPGFEALRAEPRFVELVGTPPRSG